MATRITTTALLTANGETTNASIDVINDGETTIITADRFVGNLNGNADTATRLNEPFRLNFTGDAKGSVMLGTGNAQVDLTVTHAQEAIVANRTGRAANADISNFAHLANLANFAVYAGRANFATEAHHSELSDLSTRALQDGDGNVITSTYSTITGTEAAIDAAIMRQALADDAKYLSKDDAAETYETKVAASLKQIRDAVVYGQATGTGEVDGNTLRILITDLASELAQSILEYTGEFDPTDKLTTQLYCNYEAHALYWYSPSSERWINLLGEGTDTEEIWHAIRELQNGGIASGVVMTPVNQSPLDEAEQVSVLPTLVATTYKNAFLDDARLRREFRICASGDQFQHIIWSGNANADSLKVTADLPQNTAFDWQCRDLSEAGLYSQWSGYTTFRTSVAVEIVKPVVSVSTKSDNTVVENPTITISPFALNNLDASDTCASTTITVKKKSNNATVYNTVLEGDITNYQLPKGYLQVSTLYEITVTKVGETYPAVTSNPVNFTTAARFAYIEAPSITLNTYQQNNVGKFPTFTMGTAVLVDDTDTITGLECSLYDASNNLIERQVVATDGTSTTTYAVQSGLLTSQVYTFKAKYIGTNLLGDTGSNTFRTRARFQYVQAPTVTVEQQSSGVMPNPHLYGSAFTVIESEVQDPEHTSTTWRLTDLTTGNVIWSSNNDTVNKTSIQVNANLVEGHRYRAEVTYNSDDIPDSDTGTIQFQAADTFIYVNNPSLVVEGAASDVPQFPTLSIGGFSLYNGTSDPVTDQCVNTIIKVYDSTDHLLRTYNAPSTETTEEVEGETVTTYTPVTSYRITENFMTADTTYKFAVQHVGQTYGTSSETVVTAKTLSVYPYIVTPTLTSDANNRGEMEHPILTTSAYRVTDGEVDYANLYAHTSTSWYAYKVTEENGETVKTLIWSSVNDTTHLTSIQMDTALDTDSSYEFKAIHNSTLLSSAVGVKQGTTPSVFGYVKQPVVISPVAGGQVGLTSGVTITTDAFDTMYLSDTHASSDWYLSKQVDGSASVILSAEASSDLLSHTFSAADLSGAAIVSGDALIPQVKHRGTVLGASEISAPFIVSVISGFLPDNVPDAILYRHSNNHGSVIQCPYYNNKTLKLFVADAQYRTSQYKYAYKATSNLTADIYNRVENSYNYYLTQSANRLATDNPPNLSIEQLINMWSTDNTLSLKNAPLASQWKTPSGSYTLRGTLSTYLDSLTNLVPNVAMCVPNEFELMVIFLCMNAIDALDPTVDSYPQWALGNKKGTNGKRWSLNGSTSVWSSTVAKFSGAYGSLRIVTQAGQCTSYQTIKSAGAGDTIYAGAIIPVYELEIA